MAAEDESNPPSVFVVARSARARRRIRALLERAGALVAGEASSIEGLSAAEAADGLVLDEDAAAADDGGEPLVEALTPRERLVLERLADGLSNREIAARLGISEHTVKFHIAAIYGKLGVTNRAEAVRHGLRRGLIAL